MMIESVTESGSLPVLGAMMRFSGQRHRVIVGNIANFSTPNYRERELSPASFQASLSKAAAERAARPGGRRGALEFSRTRDLRPLPNGAFEMRPRTGGRNVLFHDKNNRDLERSMQDLTENVAAFRVASELWKQEAGLLRSAISERV